MAISIKLVLLLTIMCLHRTTAEIVIDNNGYSGLMFSIQDDIPENPILLESIENSNRAKLVPKTKTVNGTFNVDNSLGSTIVFMSYDLSKAKKDKSPLVTLTDPKGKTFNRQSYECTTDENLGSIQFRILQAQIGTWNYWIDNPGDEDVKVNITITSDTKTDEKNQTKSHPIRVKSWLNSVFVKYPETSKIFAEVSKDDQPVVRANVTATGHLPEEKEETIILKDNGKGADRIANDGVYTEYLTPYNGDGRYQIIVNAESTNQTRLLINGRPGSQNQRTPVVPLLLEEIQNKEPRAELPKVNEVFHSSVIYTVNTNVHPDIDAMDPIEKFERYNPTGTILLEKWSSKDMIPSSKITDLSIMATDFTERTVHLEWTSTGDDMYDGQAKAIDLRYHHDSAILVRSFELSFSDFKIVNGSLNPLPAYEIHSIVVQLPPEETFSILNSSGNIYFAARARDDEGNLGQVSNVAIADFPLDEQLQHTNNAFPLHIVIVIAVGFVVVILVVIFHPGRKPRQDQNSA